MQEQEIEIPKNDTIKDKDEKDQENVVVPKKFNQTYAECSDVVKIPPGNLTDNETKEECEVK